MKKWFVAQKKADFDAIGKKYGISPYLARIIRNRDVILDSDINLFLNGQISDMHSPNLLNDADIAADIIIEALMAGIPIRVIGDYDIDGVCASYILSKSIRLFGGESDVRLPDRVKDGYGLNMAMIDEAIRDGIELIITCDNGIAAAKEIEYALNNGISVIVTDHHEVPYETDENGNVSYILPKADAVVDPKREDSTYPFDGICGAMVAYKVICLVAEKLINEGNMDKYMPGDESVTWKELQLELLQFAAFATVGDVMELKDENRICVKHGINLMKATKNVGMRALIEVTGIDINKMSPYHIGFVLGPCVNATGRLESAMRALKLFECEDYIEAVNIANELYEINTGRKNLTVLYTDKAIETVKNEYPQDKVIVVYLPDCHESLAGIVAGRIKETFYRPSIVLTKAEGGVKGSARSIEDYNMYEELSKVSHLFTKFGGHKMAAGMSLASEEDVETLRKLLNSNCTLSDEQLIEKCIIDIPMPLPYVSIDLIHEMEKLEPFGVGNQKPLFAQKDVSLCDVKLVGKNENVLKMTFSYRDLEGNLKKVGGICFDNAKDMYEKICDKQSISILYTPVINEYMGRESVEILVKDWCL